jgi:hypothetical protein
LRNRCVLTMSWTRHKSDPHHFQFNRLQEWIPNCRLVMTKKSSPILKSHTGNTSSLRWVGGWLEIGYIRGGCHMDWLSGLSLVCLICE